MFYKIWHIIFLISLHSGSYMQKKNAYPEKTLMIELVPGYKDSFDGSSCFFKDLPKIYKLQRMSRDAYYIFENEYLKEIEDIKNTKDESKKASLIKSLSKKNLSKMQSLIKERKKDRDNIEEDFFGLIEVLKIEYLKKLKKHLIK